MTGFECHYPTSAMYSTNDCRAMLSFLAVDNCLVLPAVHLAIKHPGTNNSVPGLLHKTSQSCVQDCNSLVIPARNGFIPSYVKLVTDSKTSGRTRWGCSD